MVHLSENTPLARYNLFQTTDLDEAREAVGRVFCPHRLTIAGEQARFRTIQNHVDTGPLSLSYIEYGADVEIEPGELESFYLIQIPLAGAAAIRSGRKGFIADPGHASILNPTRYTTMRWWAGCRKLQIQVSRRVLESIAAGYYGRDIDVALTFDATMDLTRPDGAAWMRRVVAFMSCVERDGGMPGAADRHRFYASELLRELIEIQENSHSHFAVPVGSGPLPGFVKKAVDYIHAHADEPLTSADIARASGVAGRTLQYGFRRFLGATPMQVLRDERLDRCRLAFSLADGDASVADTARRWGFTHLGRFSQSYRQRFGESPGNAARRG